MSPIALLPFLFFSLSIYPDCLQSDHSPLPTLKLTEVQGESEFSAILEVHRAAFGHSFRHLWTLLYPTLSDSPDTRARALADSLARTIGLHKADPCSHWTKVTDTDSGRVVGAARWIISTSNPFKGLLVVDCLWWPEGERREFAEICMRQFRAPRFEKMQRDHVCRFLSYLQHVMVRIHVSMLVLNVCCTHPEYRWCGIGRMLMEWGVEHGDQLDLDTYVDASGMGKPLYEAYGFEVVDEHRFSAPKTDPSPVWQEMEATLLPYEWWGMVRLPNKGKAHSDV